MRLFAIALPLACAVAEPDVAPRSASEPALTATPKRQRGTVIGGEKVARPIAWPASPRHDVARDRYDAKARAAIARSPVPVLGPDDPLARATMIVGAHWYALNVQGDGYTMHVDGSGQARVYPHIKTFERTHPMRSGDGFFTRNEGVWSATWIEHGAAYSFELECDRREVKWCDDESAILARVEALVYLGGQEVGR
jgi:hypothetical protein